MGAVELMSVDDMLNAVGLAGILFYFLTPTIVVILCAYVYNRHKKKKEIKAELLKKQQESAVAYAEGVKVLENDEQAMKVLENITYSPKNKEKYRSLSLEFDNNGLVKN